MKRDIAFASAVLVALAVATVTDAPNEEDSANGGLVSAEGDELFGVPVSARGNRGVSALGQANRSISRAAAVLLDVANRGTSEEARVSAARAVIELRMRLREVDDVDRRVRALEDAVFGEKHRGSDRPAA
jgi:hypothetical protein